MTPPRATTTEAFQRMLVEGRLPKMRWKVWALLFREPFRTRNEIDKLLSQGQVNAGFSRRLAEMERLGIIARGPVRLCTVSGHKAETWFACDQLPGTPSDPPPKHGTLLRRLGEALRREIKAGAAQADPAGCIQRMESAVRELGLT